MKTRTTASTLIVIQTVPPDPVFMQKYSDEVRKRIAKNPTNSMNNGGGRRGGYRRLRNGKTMSSWSMCPSVRSPARWC